MLNIECWSENLLTIQLAPGYPPNADMCLFLYINFLPRSVSTELNNLTTYEPKN